MREALLCTLRQPQLSPTRSEFAAHCDPSLPGQFSKEVTAFISSSPGMPMSNQSGKLLSAVLVASFAGGTLVFASHGPARADDACLSAPKATTPQGSHWYYRVERGTKRHCWYLGDERGKTAQTATPKPVSPVTTADEPSQKPRAAPLQPSVANARAEFTDTNNGKAPSPPSSSDTTSSGTPPPVTDTAASTVTTRWPDPAASTVQPQLAAAMTKPNSQLVGERAEPGPAVRVVSAPAPEASSYSMPMLLGGLAGALAFAGFLGFAVVKFGSLSRLSRIRRRPESIWDIADAGGPPPWQPRDDDTPPSPNNNSLRSRREIEAQSRDIMQILSRASREAVT